MRPLHLVAAVLVATVAAAEVTEVEIDANGDVHGGPRILKPAAHDADVSNYS